jgi:hypothetical protein
MKIAFLVLLFVLASPVLADPPMLPAAQPGSWLDFDFSGACEAQGGYNWGPIGNGCYWYRSGDYQTTFCPPSPLNPEPPNYPDPNNSPETPESCTWEYNYDYVGDGGGPILKRRCCNGACGQWSPA